jgi:hypothetical protein
VKFTSTKFYENPRNKSCLTLRYVVNHRITSFRESVSFAFLGCVISHVMTRKNNLHPLPSCFCYRYVGGTSKNKEMIPNKT